MIVSYVTAGLYVLLGGGALFLVYGLSFPMALAIALSVAVTVGLFFLESKLQKMRLTNGDLKLWSEKMIPTKKELIVEFVQIGIATLLINIAMSIFNNDIYAVHYWSEYESEYGFLNCLDDCVPDAVGIVIMLIIPVLLYVLVVAGRKYMSLFAGVFALLGVVSNNTIAEFGEYYYVAAAGNERKRFTDVSDFKTTVTLMFFILAIGLIVLALINIIADRKKGKVWIIVSVVSLLIGGAALGGAYIADKNTTTFDITQIKMDVYGDSKAFSDKFLGGGSSFSNKYGSAGTKCAHSGCDNYIASSGDTNCCTDHSRNCLNCGCYIDEDAMYCMTCIESALK